MSKTIGNPKLTWNLINELTGAQNLNNNAGSINYIDIMVNVFMLRIIFSNNFL